ncbi:MAG TPA: recombination protein O N-terminal domain-containing protein [Candidatus Paceibacterota bacterium]|nr:recombination protein O N-terminal domain-containing protein [Candidatus Paceibacterota bacterium]
MAYHIYQTKAFILGGINVGEDSRLIRFFTHDLGVVQAKAQGVRKLSSKNRAHLQDFSYGSFSYVYGKSGWRLVGAEKDEGFFVMDGLGESQEGKENLKTTAKLLALLDRLSPGEEANVTLFTDFESGIQFLFREHLSEQERKSFETLLASKILFHLGYWDKAKDEQEFSYPENFSLEKLQIASSDRRRMNTKIYHALGYSQL